MEKEETIYFAFFLKGKTKTLTSYLPEKKHITILVVDQKEDKLLIIQFMKKKKNSVKNKRNHDHKFALVVKIATVDVGLLQKEDKTIHFVYSEGKDKR